MSFENFLAEQLKRHPSMQPQDIIKMCYQASHGAEHLLKDLSAAREYLQKEYQDVKAEDIALYENISDNVCRINLAAWKFRNLPIEWLFNMFAAAASIGVADDLLRQCIANSEKFLETAKIGFTVEMWQNYLSEYKQKGMPAISHTEIYRKAEKPSYRLVNSRYIRLLPILEAASRLKKEDKVCVVAIDGRAASGKSTVAKQLNEIIGADIVQMDDFFLPLTLRTKERFDMAGGNIHYERFIDEVLPYISKSQSFSYRAFDCSKMDYNGSKKIDNTNFRIVEGSYSCHPLFKDYADITVFSDVKPEEQMNRILIRNGKELAKAFESKWIPLEEKYFKSYSISQKADIII